ncbi:hypothetical protein QJS10_CPA05g00085 [Acorus calamus]|uniref:Protein CHUP1, chloroplastic n=1 Tax=Acorus calamus TaxID=4465 RepID=A0AAV9EUZ0_ACOCL|nr:hypothetical protein QJS10_CPA05g00085 [Acorus calamus]
MKQELPVENKASPITPTRTRASPRPKDSPRSEAANGVSPGLKPRLKATALDANATQKTRRSLVPPKEVARISVRPENRAVRAHRIGDDPDRRAKELQRRLDESESSVAAMMSELEKLRCLNSELEEQNRRCLEELELAQAKVSALERQSQGVSVVEEVKNPNFSDVQKLISKKLENIGLKKGPLKIQPSSLAPAPKPLETPPKIVKSAPPPPPPPPPPPRTAPTCTAAVQKSPALLEFYHSLTKRDPKKDSTGNKSSNASSMNNAHSSVVGEFQNRSAHLLAIKADVETKGDFIRSLIQKVQSAAYTEIEDVLSFIDWLDVQLSSLADERAVLKHFNWPERKADAMREAAFEYRNLKRLEIEVSSHEDDAFIPIEIALKKMESLMEKSEHSIQRLVRLRDSNTSHYKENKIPTEWMLDSGMVNKMKLSAIKLAKTYMKRVSTELASIRPSERESMSESLLVQGVRFAYRAHQFAGGLDSETMLIFEEMRLRVRSHDRGNLQFMTSFTS